MTDFKKANVRTDSVQWSETEEMVIEGDYVGKDEGVGPNESTIYKIRLESGKVVSVWGTTVIDDCFAEGNEGSEIPVGAIVRITCHGKRAGKSGPSKQPGKGYWAFDVEFAIPSPAFKRAAKDDVGAQLAVGGQSADTKAPETDDGY